MSRGSHDNRDRNTKSLVQGVARIARQHGVRADFRHDLQLMILEGPGGVAFAVLRTRYRAPVQECSIEALALLQEECFRTESWCPDDMATGRVRRLIKELAAA